MNDLFILMKHELVVTAIIFLLLFIKVGKGMKNETLLPLVQTLLLISFIAGFFFNKPGHLFGDMYHTEQGTVLLKNILSLAVYLISLVCSGWLKRTPHLAEFFLLMLSALLGMFLMISSGNLLMFYLSLELSSIPVAAMANFDLDKKRSSEGAMKMILSSAFSSGILLFGISLIYGTTGTINFATLPSQLDGSPLQVLAFIFLFAAFAFKLSVVPFHLWTADVYEGSPIATTSFLSVVSKGAVAFILLIVLYHVFRPMYETWIILLMALSIATMLVGNIFAIRQQNIKRFLAYSSIAQAGYILAAMINGGPAGFAAVTYFVLVYVFSNLAAFGVAAVMSAQTGRENIDEYKGLYQHNPFLAWIMALAMFSLAGIPPTAGFFGKLFLLTAAGEEAAYWFITIAALNMIISLYYYLRVVRAMFIDKNDTPAAPVRTNASEKLGLIICGAGIVLAGMLSWVYDYIYKMIT